MSRKLLIILGVVVLIVLVPWLAVKYIRNQNLNKNIISVSENKDRFEVIIDDQREWNRLLDQVGWGKDGECRLLSAKELNCQELRDLKITYSTQAQFYLNQTAGPGEPVFASVGENFDAGVLELVIHVDPERFEKEGKNPWWISHQVIWALETIFNSKLDQQMYEKFKDSKLLIIK